METAPAVELGEIEAPEVIERELRLGGGRGGVGGGDRGGGLGGGGGGGGGGVGG